MLSLAGHAAAKFHQTARCSAKKIKIKKRPKASDEQVEKVLAFLKRAVNVCTLMTLSMLLKSIAGVHIESFSVSAKDYGV
jgi:hypothetical protein